MQLLKLDAPLLTLTHFIKLAVIHAFHVEQESQRCTLFIYASRSTAFIFAGLGHFILINI